MTVLKWTPRPMYPIPTKLEIQQKENVIDCSTYAKMLEWRVGNRIYTEAEVKERI